MIYWQIWCWMKNSPLCPFGTFPPNAVVRRICGNGNSRPLIMDDHFLTAKNFSVRSDRVSKRTSRLCRGGGGAGLVVDADDG